MNRVLYAENVNDLRWTGRSEAVRGDRVRVRSLSRGELQVLRLTKTSSEKVHKVKGSIDTEICSNFTDIILRQRCRLPIGAVAVC